ncbi:MAG: hypothetical protein KBT02_12110 [Treponema sp.]|nr:hypothetical protein [Candidatus Treponema caballi]
MDQNKSLVYAKVDDKNRITAIDGGYTIGNIKDFSEWVFVDEGAGDKYNLCQGNYLDKPITDDRGIYRYKLVGGKPVERTSEEMDEDYEEIPAVPTQLDRIAAQALYTALMTDTLIEEGIDDV